LTLPPEAFSLVDAEGRRVVELGRFRLGAGLSSRKAEWTVAEVTLE
jgi:hypothetical protein